ncbi:YceI family protein [Aurantiacibacter suaedae]|uniref:YceI family protein n=1 Tax=Aurantiacibacter suaedae TaxID=2545755 RepID=UPI0010F5BDC5|nr:YceI family protein [Aurantiacibacter suaedae]
MRKTLLATVAAAGMATLALGTLNAQDAPAPGAIDLAAVDAGDYATDPAHSLVVWEISHLGFNDYFGIFGDVEGTLSIDPANVEAAALDVTIPIAAVTVPSEGLKDHLLRPGKDGGDPDFFGPEPEAARFVSTAVHKTGDTTAHIMGDLTFNGVTKPVTIQAELSGMGTNAMSQKETLGFHGTTTIKRSDWNLAWGIPFGISDEVDLEISVAFEK